MKKRIGVAAVVGAVLLVTGWTGYAQAQRTEPPRQAWQYRIEVTSDRTQRVDVAAENQRILDTRAAEGWELAAVGNGFFYFRRPK